jgi:L-2-amino-thiazoline-4-carboxylic acid hydrolase-like protein
MDTDPFDLTGDGNVHDLERAIDDLVDALFDHVAATLREHGLPGELRTAMRARHAELTAANASMAVDEPSRHNLRLTLAVVAAYEPLLPRLGRDAAFEAVRAALVEPLGHVVREGTLAMLDAAPDPFSAMVEVCKAQEEHAYGRTFTFERPVDDDREYLLEIHRCFYHDVLTANSAAELTPALCAFDANWIEAIDPDRHGFRFERTTTIGLGGAHCPFHFIRTRPRESGDG